MAELSVTDRFEASAEGRVVFTDWSIDWADSKVRQCSLVHLARTHLRPSAETIFMLKSLNFVETISKLIENICFP